MNEFAQLLKEAAGQPPRPLNMAAVRTRAARIGLRRRAAVSLWAVLAVLGIGVGVPTGVSLMPSGDRPTDGRTMERDRDVETPARPERTTRTVIDSRQDDGDGFDMTRTGAGSDDAATGEESAAGNLRAPKEAGAETHQAAGSSPAATTAEEGCSAEGHETGTAFGGVGDWPRCSYQASRPGGYRAEPNTEFEITLTGADGYQRVIRGGCQPARPNCKASYGAPSCAPIGTIRAGDRVDVRIVNTTEDGAGWILVGSHASC